MTSIHVTINLPEETYQSVERFARLTNRDLSSVLAELTVSCFPSLIDGTETVSSVMGKSDRTVSNSANSALPEMQN